MKQTQIETIYQICRELCPLRMEQLKIQAMYKGISCGDRHVRTLRRNFGLVSTYKAKGDATDTIELTDLGKNTPKLPDLPHNGTENTENTKFEPTGVIPGALEPDSSAAKPVLAVCHKPKPAEAVKVKITSTPNIKNIEQLDLKI